MNTNVINAVIKTRQYLIEQIKDLTIEELNTIPDGFNNNIAWNLGHLVAAQQGICYIRAGAKLVVEERYFSDYRPGTKPERYIDEKEIDEIKKLMLSTIDTLKADYPTGMFSNYPEWITRYGVAIASIDEAIQFLLFHEGLHSGTIGSMKRLVNR